MRTGEPDRYGRPTTSVRRHRRATAGVARQRRDCIRSLLEAENRSPSVLVRTYSHVSMDSS